MKKRKEIILDIAIDLFAEQGVRDVSLEMIADRAGIKRSTMYHHFKRGKDEITDGILAAFNALIAGNMPQSANHGETMSAEGILSSLYLRFSDADTERGRKINRIIFMNYGYDSIIAKYLSEVFYEKRETRFVRVFDALIASGRVKHFEPVIAARMLNRIFIAYALEDTFAYPFESDTYDQLIDRLRHDCTLFIGQLMV